METLIKNHHFVTSLEWKNKGNLVPVLDKNIFTIDTNNNENCLVILHGFLTSSYDYHKVLPELSKNYRVIIQDFIGFGFSDKPENKYFTIIDQVDYLLRFWKTLGLRNITLLAHDYGALVAKEVLARQNLNIGIADIKRVIFCNGSMPIDHVISLNSKVSLKNENAKKMIAMLTSFGIYKKNIRDLFFDKNKISDEELKEMWIQLEQNDGRDMINFIHHYIRERKIFWNRWITALNETDIPVKLIWSKEDPLADEKSTRLLSEKITYNEVCWIENVGHYPMLEAPEKWMKCVLSK